MKRWVCMLLAVGMLLTFTACNNNVQAPHSVLSEDEETASATTLVQAGASEEKAVATVKTEGKATAKTTKKNETDNKGEQTGGKTQSVGTETVREETPLTTASTARRTRPTTASRTRLSTAPTAAPAETDIPTNDPKELLWDGLLLTSGRVTAGAAGLSMPYSDSGITICGELEGAVSVGLTLGNNGCVLNVVVDGDDKNVKTVRLSAGDHLMTACTGLKKGFHTIEITRGTAYNYGSAVLHAVYYDGKLQAPKAKDLQLEFIGDSVTCSEGNVAGANAGYSVDGHNSFYGYAALTARALDAGLAVEAVCGQKTAGMRTRFNDTAWDFANNQKDVVVVNLGTNDVGWSNVALSTVEADLRTNVIGLIDDIRAKYGKDTYIVWAYGMMFDKDKAFFEKTVTAYAAQSGDARVLYCDMSAVKNTKGYGSHPSMEGHAAAAQLLTAFIKENCNI